MNESKSLTIYQAMARILADIDFIGKDRKADMGNAGRYNFRGIDDIYNALHFLVAFGHHYSTHFSVK